MAVLSQECFDRLKELEDSFAKVEEILGLVDDLRSITGAVSDLTTTNILNVVGPTTEADRPDFQAAGNALASGVLAVATFANNVAEQTGNERVVDFDQVKGATDLLLLANPGAVFTLVTSVVRRIESLVNQARTLGNDLKTDVADLRAALAGVDDNRQEFDDRNRALKEEILTQLGDLRDDIDAIIDVTGLFVPQASVDTICEDLNSLAFQAIPRPEFGGVMRALRDVIADLEALSNVLEQLLDFIDNTLNYEQGFRAEATKGLVAVKRKLLLVLRDKVNERLELLELIPPSDSFRLSQIARDLQVDFLWIRELLCRDDPAIQKRIDDDPNAGAFGNLVSALSAVGLTEIEEFRDNITETIRRIRAAVVRKDEEVFGFLDDLLDTVDAVLGVMNAISLIITTYNPGNIENAVKSVKNLLESQGFDRIRTLIDDGRFDEYFESAVDTASTAAAVAECVSRELDAFDGLARVQLERVVRDSKGIERAQAARAQAQSGRRSDAILAQQTQSDDVKGIGRTLRQVGGEAA